MAVVVSRIGGVAGTECEKPLHNGRQGLTVALTHAAYGQDGNLTISDMFTPTKKAGAC